MDEKRVWVARVSMAGNAKDAVFGVGAEFRSEGRVQFGPFQVAMAGNGTPGANP